MVYGKVYRATVDILIRANDDGQAADVISSLLSEYGIHEPESGVVDWAYQQREGRYLHAKEVQFPPSYTRDEDHPCDLALASPKGEITKL